jgi:hypothetical protein
MSFKLSNRSLGKLEGVHPDMVATVKRAIELTKVDFGITCGLRTVEEQKRLVATGRSQTMNSKHIPQSDEYSHAVDCLAYVDGDVFGKSMSMMTSAMRWLRLQKKQVHLSNGVLRGQRAIYALIQARQKML